MNNEIMSKLEDQHKAITEFQAKYSGEIDRLEKEIDDIVKRGRPGPGAGFDGPVNRQEVKAFTDFLKDGGQGHFVTESKSVTLVDGADVAVPSAIDSRVENLALPFSPMRRVCRVARDTTGDFTLLVNTRGLVVGRVGEKDARPETAAPGLEEIKPVVGELYANPAITQKALDDIFFDSANWLTTEIAEAFGVAENFDFVNGNGTNRAKGILTYTTAATGDATRAFGTIQHLPTGTSGAFKTQSSTVSPADDLIDMIYALKAAYRSGAVWQMNSKTLGVIRKWKDLDGNYIWQPPVSAGQPGQILGYDVVENEAMPDPGAGAIPIMFGNFQRAYVVVDRLGIRLIRDPYTNKPYVHFYTTKRVGGALVNSEAVKFLKMSAA